MLKKDVTKLLNLSATSDIDLVFAEARKYVKSVHSDANPEKHLEWMKFETAWDVIKRLHTQRKSFDEYDFELANVPGWKHRINAESKKQSGGIKDAKSDDTKSKANQARKTTQVKGSNIHIVIRIKFDDIVYGRTLRVKLPPSSSFYQRDGSENTILVAVTPTPIWTNKDGSISKRALNGVFGKKIRVVGAGEKGSFGGGPGDLEITFEVTIGDNPKAIIEAVETHFQNYRNLNNREATYFQNDKSFTNHISSPFDFFLFLRLLKESREFIETDKVDQETPQSNERSQPKSTGAGCLENVWIMITVLAVVLGFLLILSRFAAK